MYVCMCACIEVHRCIRFYMFQIYIYIYVCVCVCVCACAYIKKKSKQRLCMCYVAHVCKSVFIDECVHACLYVFKYVIMCVSCMC